MRGRVKHWCLGFRMREHLKSAELNFQDSNGYLMKQHIESCGSCEMQIPETTVLHHSPSAKGRELIEALLIRRSHSCIAQPSITLIKEEIQMLNSVTLPR